MASISKLKNGRKAIQFFDKTGKRRALQVGKVSLKIAQGVKIRIESIVSAQIAGHAVDDVTALWLSKLDKTMNDKLAKVGLIDAGVSATLGELIDDFTNIQSGDVKPRTLQRYANARMHLTNFFGDDKPLKDLNAASAKEWRSYLIGKGLAENTIRKLCGVAKTFINYGIDKELLVKNPFKAVPSALVFTRERHYYLTPEDTKTVIDACPDAEWRLIVALARYGGLRTPSETFALRLDDINWEHNRFYVRSPKTERYEGKEGRTIPIFPDLKPYLEECFDNAADGAEYVIVRHRLKSDNLRTRFAKIIKSAGLTPWPKPFQNLRSSRETELIEQFPIQTVVSWIGNSPTVAMQSYLQVRESDFEKATQEKLHIRCSPERNVAVSSGQEAEC